MLRRTLLSLLALSVSIDLARVSAFGISPRPSSLPKVVMGNKNTPAKHISPPRGGGGTAVAVSEAAPSAPPPKKRVRITALDGIRALLALHIVLGHFLRFAKPPAALLKFFAQVNITVGAFFAISGYVTAYTSTEVGERKASSRLTDTPSQKWWLGKVMSFFPMHWLVLLLFSPMFVYSDVTYGGWSAATINGLLSATLTQAWFPMHGEVWNAPTWFLSTLAFSMAVVPFALPKIAEMDKRAVGQKKGLGLGRHKIKGMVCVVDED